jgi:hypothetical protein
VQLPLREVFVSLNAHPETSSTPIDRPIGDTPSAGDVEDRTVASLDYSEAPTGEVALEAIVEATTHAVLLGDPGAGKTTLLKYLATQAAETALGAALGGQPARIPVLLRISGYAQDGLWKDNSLTEFLEKYHRLVECPCDDAHRLVVHSLERGECLVLLDGLDEVVDADDRRGVVTRIEDFAKRHRRATDLWSPAGLRAIRPFLDAAADTEAALGRVRGGWSRRSCGTSFGTGWLVLDCELLPWSAKATS